MKLTLDTSTVLRAILAQFNALRPDGTPAPDIEAVRIKLPGHSAPVTLYERPGSLSSRPALRESCLV